MVINHHTVYLLIIIFPGRHITPLNTFNKCIAATKTEPDEVTLIAVPEFPGFLQSTWLF